MNLYQSKKNRIYKVISVPDIELLENLGLRNDSMITVKARYALGGPVYLRVEDAFNIALGKDVATQITVREVLS